MKKLLIPYLPTEAIDVDIISDKLSLLPRCKIESINWPDEYPSKPDVEFTIAHDCDNILLQYNVSEDEILGVVAHDNGEVWTDSCVEFFISFDGLSYYNIESTCVGRVLLGYRQIGQRTEHADAYVMQSIKRLPSLGFENRQLERGNFSWKLTLIIPRTAFWKTDIESFQGLSAKGNFYKCGDNLSRPHFVSWSEIVTEKPNFHQPNFFGDLQFE